MDSAESRRSEESIIDQYALLRLSMLSLEMHSPLAVSAHLARLYLFLELCWFQASIGLLH